MCFLYSGVDENGRDGRQFYIAAYLNRGAPSHKIFGRIYNSLRKGGSLTPNIKDCYRNKTFRTLATEGHVLQRVEKIPETSLVRAFILSLSYSKGIRYPQYRNQLNSLLMFEQGYSKVSLLCCSFYRTGKSPFNLIL